MADGSGVYGRVNTFTERRNALHPPTKQKERTPHVHVDAICTSLTFTTVAESN